MTKDIPLKCLSSTVTGHSFWRDDMDSYWRKEMKDNLDEEDGPNLCTLPKHSHTPVFFQASKQTSWEMRGEGKNNESVFQGDDKNSSC